MCTKTFYADTPAKVNLDLYITGRRDDGYHFLDSVFVPVPDLCDTVKVSCSKGSGVLLQISGCDSTPADSSNLAWKAAAKIIDFTSAEVTVEIELVKRIPVAAGLGGGSSDAAAVLRLVNSYLAEKGQGVSESVLRKLALSIGADVPFFINPSIARVTGIGENIEPLEVRRQKHLLLVSPDFHISAVEAYRLYRDSGAEFGKADRSAGFGENDLEAAVANKYVALQVVRDAVAELPNVEHFALSGSGPTYFAIFATESDAKKAADLIKEKYPFLPTYTSTVNLPAL